MTKLFIYCCVVSALLCCSAIATQAQVDLAKYEVGVHFTTLQVSEKGDHDSGVGARFTYNLNKYIGLEAEGNMLPQTREGGGNNETQGFFGVRAGIRNERFGVFAKARPGFTRFNLLGINPGVNTFEQGHTRFAMDVGGGVEYYATQHISLRVYAGDTMIQYKPGDFFYHRLDEPNPVTKQLSHNLQIMVGVAYRF
jgi:opacity protein-like surface antigen